LALFSVATSKDHPMKTMLGRAATIWVYLALGLIIAGALAFLGVGLVFITPICNKVVMDSAPGPRGFDAFLPGATSFLALLQLLVDYAAWWVGALLIVGMILEWRVRTENATATSNERRPPCRRFTKRMVTSRVSPPAATNIVA
jgi:hypothetical protein